MNLKAEAFKFIVCDGTSADPCTFWKLMELGKNVIDTMIVLATFFTIIVFVYAGVKLLASAGNPKAMEDAKKMFKMTLIGYLWILGAWVIVYTILKVLVKPEFFQTFFK